ncbi:MAG TPA: hypothetical protein VKN18_24115, partial [Blastocatellia bacterium]|nr:hypothetical protein [Blastocatellia bacterium]
KKKVSKAEVTKFDKFIAAHSEKSLPDKELKDQQTERILKLVKTKKSRGKDVVETDVESTREDNVVEIMDVLKKSLAAGR